MSKPGTIVLVIRPDPEGRDRFDREPMYRLKVLLKRMLRVFGWRLVSIDPVENGDGRTVG